MNSDNVLKIGLFGANCSSGRAATLVEERWSGGWAECVDLARAAEEAGLEFMLPIGRWKGYGGRTDYQGATLETITWAAGLLALTHRLTVFGTVHAPLIAPLVAAKQFVTADHIGQGRFGLNVVCGWNEDEFDMFGVTLREHEARYGYAQEWLDVVRTAWSDAEDFDFDGRFIKVAAARAKPKPYGGRQPMIMNAGMSPVGQAFAVRNCDALFTVTQEETLDATAEHVRGVKALAAAQGRDIEVYTVGVVTCRRSRAEAEDYYRHCILENADWEAVDAMLARRRILPQDHTAADFAHIRDRYANGMGGLTLVGDPDDVAAKLARISGLGLAGVALSFVHYGRELPFFRDEVLPRLERLGLREAA